MCPFCKSEKGHDDDCPANSMFVYGGNCTICGGTGYYHGKGCPIRPEYEEIRVRIEVKRPEERRGGS